MKVLVTGGTGVVGKVAVDRLLEHGHSVRLLSRHADRDGRQWVAGVEPWAGSVGNDDSIRGAAAGCDAVLHIAGIVRESPPEVTFEQVNVEGTRRILREAERARVRRFVFVSSLGAGQGASDYHRSKYAAEKLVAQSELDWLVVRPGNVYGPGDEVISLLLKMVRTLPAVPVVGSGDQPFQPVWAGDLAEVLVRALERTEPSRQMLDLAGPEVTSMNDLLDLLEKITQRSPVRIPVPEWLARSGAGAMESLGLDLPVNSNQLTMLVEENVIPPGQKNALTEVFGVQPTRLAEGIAKLADSLLEQLPTEGVGSLHQQRYWADVRGSRLDADALFEMVRNEFGTLAPDGLLEVGAEPGTQQGRLEEGDTLTMAIPMRGTIQVRVRDIRERTMTFVTLEGHPLSGVIQFKVEDRGDLLRFEIRSYTRASDLVDLVGMRTVGRVAQQVTWQSVVQEVVRRSGGEAVEGVQSDSATLDEEKAERIERWVEELVTEKKREENPGTGE